MVTIPEDAIEVTLGARASDHYAGLVVGGIGLFTGLVGLGMSWAFSDAGTPTVIATSVVGVVGILTAVVGFVVHYATVPF